MENELSPQLPYPIPGSDEKVRQFTKRLPSSPGVYKFLDRNNNPLYIGKAKSIKNRVSSYFRNSSQTKKIKVLIQESKSIEFALTNTELDSLLLEQFLIKEFKPKFNIQFKDDKGYPWIFIETESDFPSAKSYLGKKRTKGKFFGPFPNPYAVRDALKLIQKTFKLRNCSDVVFKNRSRPCLQYEIGRCSAPCVDFISNKEYLEEVKGAELLLTGNSDELINDFYMLMDSFSSNKEFEKAALYRDRISALRDIQRTQSVTGFSKSRDAVHIASFDGIVKIGVTHVNQGWVTGHENFIQDKGLYKNNILEKFLLHKYCTKGYCPEFIIISQKIKNKALIEKALSQLHSKKISIISRLSKKDQGLLEICKTNTEFIFTSKKDNKIKSKLEELKKGLKLTDDIRYIESYDISHHSGANAVGGCVVYTKDGKEKNLYRSYNISKENSGNDIASMIELIERRFSPASYGKKPNLIILDGGKTHLNLVKKKFIDMNIPDINIISISKGIRRKASFDSIHLPNGKTISLSENTMSHNFIQEIRDETHRYAITLQKRKRSKSSIKSFIDNIKGVGPAKKKLLLRYFGSLEQIKRASIEDLSEVSGIGRNTAENVFKEINQQK